MGRSLDDEFFKAFQCGVLSHVTSAILHDNTLDFEIRSNAVHIYYRGGKILEITKREQLGVYKFAFSRNYFANDNKIELPVHVVKSEQDVKSWIDVIPLLKRAMDFHFTKRMKSEREFQQLIVRENTYSNVSNETDFFFTDLEYKIQISTEEGTKDVQFDLIGLLWPALPVVRKYAVKARPRLALFELKYGDGALSGDSGMLSHLKDMLAFAKSQNSVRELKDEVVNHFKLKRDLRLVNISSQGKSGEICGLSDEKPMFIFLLANHNPRSTVLKTLLTEDDNKPPTGSNNEFLVKHAELSQFMDIRYATASMLGYGLYESSLLTLDELLKHLELNSCN